MFELWTRRDPTLLLQSQNGIGPQRNSKMDRLQECQSRDALGELLFITGLTDDRRWRLELDRKRGLIPIGRKIEYGRFNPQTNQFEPSGETIESRVEWSVFQNTQVPFQLHQVLTRPANQFKQTTTITLEWKSVE